MPPKKKSKSTAKPGKPRTKKGLDAPVPEVELEAAPAPAVEDPIPEAADEPAGAMVVDANPAPEPASTDVTMAEGSSDAIPQETIAQTALDVANNVAHVAEEFVEQLNGPEITPPESGGGNNIAEEGPMEMASEVIQGVVGVAQEFVEQLNGTAEVESEQAVEDAQKLTMEERKAKLQELRKKMHNSSLANRVSLVEENTKAKVTARELARLERQRKLAETLREKADAEERGEDVERKKNWEWTIEENDNWEKKKARKARRANFEFNNDADAARRRYKKDLDMIKPDLEAYNRQKELALGLEPGTLARQGTSSSSAITSFNPLAASSSSTGVVPTSYEQKLAAENLYRDANSLLYADNKPSEDAIDRVVSKINKDIDKKGKFSRKRLNEDEGDITYINERNRVFNKKIARYYDKYTAEIRASFERGTAL